MSGNCWANPDVSAGGKGTGSETAKPRTRRAFGCFLATLSSRLGFAVHELLRAGLCHGRIRAVAARRRRPPAFFDQLTVLPGRAALECCEFGRRISLRHEALHADGDQHGRHGFARTFAGHPLRTATQDLSPPAKAEDHDPHGADHNTPAGGFNPLRDFHATPPSTPPCSSEHHAAQNLMYDIICRQ